MASKEGWRSLNLEKVSCVVWMYSGTRSSLRVLLSYQYHQTRMRSGREIRRNLNCDSVTDIDVVLVFPEKADISYYPLCYFLSAVKAHLLDGPGLQHAGDQRDSPFCMREG